VSLSWWREALVYKSLFFLFSFFSHGRDISCEPSRNPKSLRLTNIAKEGAPDRNECRADRSRRDPSKSLKTKPTDFNLCLHFSGNKVTSSESRDGSWTSGLQPFSLPVQILFTNPLIPTTERI